MKTSLVLSFLVLGAGHTSTLLAQFPGTFTATGAMTTERAWHTATLLPNGKVLIAGGPRTYLTPAVMSPLPASAELYDPSTGGFTATANLTTARSFHSATLLPDGKVLIAGGYSSIGSNGQWGPAAASAELYDPSTGTFTATGEMTTARSWHTATLLNNGRVLIAGGYATRSLNSAELYDPSTRTFTATGAMTTTAYRDPGTAALLSNGKVLIPRGFSEDEPSRAELYDPDTGTFSLTSEMRGPGLFPVTASLLTNGKVLVTLDYSCDPGDAADVYDPATGAFAATGNMTAIRGHSTSTLLPDGTVLIAARDYLVNRGHDASAELYDLATGRFRVTGGLIGQRDGHAATLLPNGTVLMSGGWYCCQTAEIYHPAVLVPSPVLFSQSGDGRGQGAILHSATHQVVSPANPAVAGEALEIYLTGLTDGSVIPPQVAIGGRMAQVLFFGKAPGFANLNQVNVRVPSGIVAGPAVGVRLTYLARPSNEVTISVR